MHLNLAVDPFARGWVERVDCNALLGFVNEQARTEVFSALRSTRSTLIDGKSRAVWFCVIS
jgi:streptogramin lyase